jgi:hypothetical protein
MLKQPDSFATTADGSGSRADPGVGKTSVLAEITELLEAAGVTFAAAREEDWVRLDGRSTEGRCHRGHESDFVAW